MTAPRRRPRRHQGRGRPRVLDEAERARYLAAVTAGLPLAQAAAAAGVSERTVRHNAQHDTGFADARKRAQAAGRTHRKENLLGADGRPIPHGEYRYIHHGCRCPACTKAATNARGARPSRAGGAGATVVALDLSAKIRKPRKAKPFPLPRAS